jgi:hypothetical protein
MTNVVDLGDVRVLRDLARRMGWPDDTFRPSRLNDSQRAWRSVFQVQRLLRTPLSVEERCVLRRYTRQAARRIFPQFFTDNYEHEAN